MYYENDSLLASCIYYSELYIDIFCGSAVRVLIKCKCRIPVMEKNVRFGAVFQGYGRSENTLHKI